ncbi:NAC domain-containing protein 53-like isoform X1 [Hibiscus syriacus]|uniref:NAC domain-containing protein 53-like isoform X1 n=1 Tax=Hibiscus syriacus TaxID=106335 RepID=UPI0019222101|nr:NAC domain-containing protein 53-like isoform X1 [Hibiscus syriacus]XP_039044044.1 NAC domain-containing protein 53-like isoform X1 [Hibiscus syriacus]
MAARTTSPLANVGFTCTNEELFIGLYKLTDGSPLPSNVIDINPYKYEPQNLPDDFWFLSSSKDNTDIKHGLWKTREEALDVFSNSDIIGWRTTLEYYNGQVPYERKTNWVMQVFSTTQKGLCDENAKKESICLCRVFLVPSNEIQRNVSSARIDTENLLPEPPVLDANCSTRIGSSSNCQVNEHDETEVLGAAERLPVPEHQGENIVEMDFISGDKINFFSVGDFLELNDLDNPASSSSSDNSSAASISSDDCFDSMAFLHDLDQDQVLDHNETGKKLNVSASNTLDEVVIVPPTLAGSLVSIEGCNSCRDELFKTTDFMSNSASGGRNLNNKVIERAKGNQRGEGPSSSRESSSSDDSFTAREGRRKRGRMKELGKKYLCFMPF